MATDGKPTAWKAVATLTSGTSLTLKGEDAFGSTVEEEVPFALDPDKAPGIEIVSPNGRAILPPGERPQIEFHVADDFGVSEVVLEEVAPNAAREDKGTEVKRWKVGDARDFRQVWKAETSPARGTDIGYRLVAHDNRPGQPNESVSATVIFNVPTASRREPNSAPNWNKPRWSISRRCWKCRSTTSPTPRATRKP